MEFGSPMIDRHPLQRLNSTAKTSLQLLLAQRARISKQIELLQQSERRCVELAGQIRQVVASAGLKLSEVIKHLQAGKQARKPRGSAEMKVAPSVDKTGSKPEVGVTYKHSSWPAAWTATGKRAPNHVIASIREGKTWSQLRQK